MIWSVILRGHDVLVASGRVPLKKALVLSMLAIDARDINRVRSSGALTTL